MTALYPIGYRQHLGDINDLKAYARFDLMDPAYAARLETWLVSREGHIGVGGAFRTTQPTKPGFAPDGKSFHQLQTFVDGGQGFMAVDLVARNGDQSHRAPRWDEVPRQGSGHSDISKFGVHCNVSGEPWHMQAIEVDGWVTWVNNGRKRPNPNFQLPPIEPPPPPPPPPPPNPVYPVPPGSFTVPTLTSLRKGAPNNVAHVQVWQSMMNRWFMYWGMGTVTPDGDFGDHTANATILFQTLMRDREGRTSTPDGIVGPQSWGNVYSDC